MLLLYAVGNRGFAHTGYAGIYAGEVGLILGIVAMFKARKVATVLRSRYALYVVLFGAWGLLRTVPFIAKYEVDALRDAVLYAYASYALIWMALMTSRPQRITTFLSAFRPFAYVFVWVLPVLLIVQHVWGAYIPMAPDGKVPLIFNKPGDIMVHLAGIFAFVMLDLRRFIWPFLAPFVGLFVLGAAVNRGGMLAFVLSFGLVFFLWPKRKKAWVVTWSAVLVLMIVVLSGVSIDLGTERKMSGQQLIENMISVVSNKNADLYGTKEWRMAWWGDILDYTLNGDYFWGGKGFGVNLATDDGYQVSMFDELRSPHNGHMTVLARMGVVGALLWILMHGHWLRYVYSTMRRARRAGDLYWARVMTFFIAYWLAFMVNTTFDVFLEGPMGGIWFWSIAGIGYSTAVCYRSSTLSDPNS